MHYKWFYKCTLHLQLEDSAAKLESLHKRYIFSTTEGHSIFVPVSHPH